MADGEGHAAANEVHPTMMFEEGDRVELTCTIVFLYGRFIIVAPMGAHGVVVRAFETDTDAGFYEVSFGRMPVPVSVDGTVVGRIRTVH